jgi:Protein of unknown function (DUF2934)
MAKRTTSRSKVSDPAAPAPSKPRRARTTAAGEPPATAADAASASVPPAEPSVEDIRRRAYERYLERGENHGRHFDDWLEAERELRSKK